MSATATATVISTDRSLTQIEALEVIEQFGLSLYPPGRGGGRGWLAGWHSEETGYRWGFGDTVVEAVEKLLREIGGGSG